MEDILAYIERMKQENEGPRITAQEPRIGLQGGQLVQLGVGRQGYGGPPVYTINEENFKLLDDLIPNTELTINEIKVKLGGNEKSGNQGINKLIDAWAASDKDRVVSEKRFRPYKMEGTELSQKIINASQDVKYIKKDGTPNIKKIAKDFFPEKKLDDARKMVRSILVAGIDYEGKKNIPGEITSAKQAKKNAYENIKIANKKAGIETTKQADQVIDKILSQNEIYQKMSVEDIAKDKNLLKRLRVQIDPVTGNVTFDGYTKKSPVRGKVFSDLELAQHAKNKADTYELFTPDHITPKAWRKQNVGYPINFQSATYMENSQLDNGRRYLMNNPDGNIKPIDNYLKSQNQTIRFGKNKYGFKLPIVFNSKTGTSNIVELSVKKTIPKFKPPVSGGPALYSGLAVFEDFLKSGAAKKIGTGLRKVGAEFEAAFIVFDFMNNLGKGIEPGEALQKSLQVASLNIYKGGDRATIENILKEAKEAGFDPKVMRSLINVNKSQNKINDFNKKINSNLKAIEDLKEKDVSNPFIQRQIKAFENLNKRMESNLDKEIEIGTNLFNTYATNVKRSKGSFKLTDDDINRSFIELHTAGIGLLKKKQLKSAKRKSTQVDVEAGPIGDVIQNAISGLWTYPKFAYDVINPFSPLPKKDAWKTEGMKEKERIIDMQKRGAPGELYRYNIARGFDIDQPLTGQAYETMIEEQPYLGLEKREDRAGGGLANLTRTVAPDSGPMSQGLRSLYIDDMDY